MQLNRKLCWCALAFLYACALLGCDSRHCDIHDNFDSMKGLVMDDDFGFCGYISCVENHDVIQYMLPDCKDFPNQYQYDSILLEISGFAEWKLENGQIQVKQLTGSYIVMFCCNSDEWDTVYYYTLDDDRPIVKQSLNALYCMASPCMKHGRYCLYDGGGQLLPQECIDDLSIKEAELQETEFKYRIRLIR